MKDFLLLFASLGAGTIVLVARSAPSQTKLEEVAALEKKTGAKVKLLQADASSHEQMRALQTNELARLPSMAGIVLTAMVLHDQIIPQLDRDTFFKVIAPKVTGIISFLSTTRLLLITLVANRTTHMNK